MVMKKKKEFGLFVKLTKEENKMVKEMKQKHCINMSQLFRNTIREFCEKLDEKKKEKKK